jgi:hypothetical protein
VVRRLALAILSLAACAQRPAEQAGPSHPRVIFRGAGAQWIPTREQVVELERKLPEAFARAAGRSCLPTDPPRPLGEYGIQYSGVVQQGARMIRGFGFCGELEEPAARLEQHIVQVNDGGCCFFDLEYDPARGEFVGLRFNGHG